MNHLVMPETLSWLDDQMRQLQADGFVRVRIDGVMYEVIEADFDTLQNFKTENHFKYWVNPETRWIFKATYKMKGSGFESFTTQFPEAVPDLTEREKHSGSRLSSFPRISLEVSGTTKERFNRFSIRVCSTLKNSQIVGVIWLD